MQVETARIFAEGRSFWRIVLTSGRSYSEATGLDWHRDIVASGNTRSLAELWLHTPAGDVALKIVRPYSAYAFMVGAYTTLAGRATIAQVIGRMDEPEAGVAFIWDVTQQRLYRDDRASVLSFAAWRPGIVAPGALMLEHLGVRL